MPVKTKIQVRRDTAANWTSTNPTLAAGEQGYETDTKKLKIGDGTTAWTSLAYFGSSSARLVQESNTTVTVVNTGAGTQSDLFSFSQAAIADTSSYRIVAGGTVFNNTGAAVTYTLRFKIGATTVLTTVAMSVGTNVQTYGWVAEFFVNMVGSKTSQKTLARLQSFRGSSNWYTTNASGLASGVGYGTSTEDLSTAKTFALTVEMGTASALAEMRCQTFTVEEITE